MMLLFLGPAAAVSVNVIEGEDPVFSGYYADAAADDYFIQNDHIAVVVSAIDHQWYYAESGGTIIDAGASDELVDELGNFYTYFDDDWPRQAVYQVLEVVDDGSGGSVVIRVTGADSNDPSINVVTDYSLADGETWVTVRTTITNTGQNSYPSFELGDAFHWGDCEAFVPGYGFSPGGETSAQWFAATGARVSYGYCGPPNTLWGPHGSDWSDINMETVSLGPGDIVTYTRYLIVGGIDIASVARVAHGCIGLDVENVTCTMTSQVDGKPLWGGEITVRNASGNLYFHMETDRSGRSVSSLPPGEWRFTSSFPKYTGSDEWWAITSGEPLDYSINLASDGSPAYAKADTLTLIQRPILAIPEITTPGDHFLIQCEADQDASEWSAMILFEEISMPLAVRYPSYDQDTGWWTITASVPQVPLYELYDLVVTAEPGYVDTARNAVRVIPAEKTDFYFVHITDPHLPTPIYHYQYGAFTDSSNVNDLREVMADIDIINPEFVVLTGDVIHEGELEDYLRGRYFSRTKRLLTEFRQPVYVTSGNHDLGGWTDTPPPAGTARRDWWRFFGWKRLDIGDPDSDQSKTQDYGFDYGGIHFTALEAYDNYESWRMPIYGATSFNEDQLLWLDDDLAGSQQSQSHVLLYHYDFASQINLQALDVDMALWGHIHHDSGSITSPPYDLATNNAGSGERSYRLIRVSDGVLHPSATVSAGYAGTNLQVSFEPANDGTSSDVTAVVTNFLNERFEHAELNVRLPDEEGMIRISGGTLRQVHRRDGVSVCYVGIDIPPYSVTTISVRLDPSMSNIMDGELIIEWEDRPDAAEFWVYGVNNQAYLDPDLSFPFSNRLAILPGGTTSWASSRGIGDQDNNWTYVIVAVDGQYEEVTRYGPWAEWDYAIPNRSIRIDAEIHY